jgi:hypothetical protein
MSKSVTSQEVSDEIEVLKAVYGEDYEERKVCYSDLDKYADIWGQPSFSIKMKPMSISERRRGAEAQFRFTLTSKYPASAPMIALEKSTGISDGDKERLLTDLQGKAAEFASEGKVMIHDLCQYVEGILTDINKSPTSNLYEEMETREKQQQRKVVQLRKDAADLSVDEPPVCAVQTCSAFQSGTLPSTMKSDGVGGRLSLKGDSLWQDKSENEVQYVNTK